MGRLPSGLPKSSEHPSSGKVLVLKVCSFRAQRSGGLEFGHVGA